MNAAHQSLISRTLVTLWIGGLIACERPRDVAVQIVARDALGHDIRCGKNVALSESMSMSLKKFRFYVHDIAFRNTRGEWIVPHQPQDHAYSGQGVWLIDLDDAGCDPELSPEAHDRLLMSLPRGAYDAMRLTLGVPEVLNHEDPMSAAPHLALTSMHWGWRAGYRFVRLDGTLATGEPYAVHVGSTSCTGDAGERITCARKNRATFTIPGPWFESGTTARLRLDVAAFLQGVDWSAPEGCMGNAEDGDCEAILKNLALDPQTGEVAAHRTSSSLWTYEESAK